ncbi:MAG: hypothetical protein J7L07_07300 [Candidatus Odinarchaeota archaeon]|nr:hypothetical protein [Candidatus Odinarchaeota archaeon]
MQLTLEELGIFKLLGIALYIRLKELKERKIGIAKSLHREILSIPTKYIAEEFSFYKDFKNEAYINNFLLLLSEKYDLLKLKEHDAEIRTVKLFTVALETFECLLEKNQKLVREIIESILEDKSMHKSISNLKQHPELLLNVEIMIVFLMLFSISLSVNIFSLALEEISGGLSSVSEAREKAFFKSISIISSIGVHLNSNILSLCKRINNKLLSTFAYSSQKLLDIYGGLF